MIASFFSGLAALVFWQAGLLVIIILFDVFVNSKDMRRASKVAIFIFLVLVGVVTPWVLYVWSTGSGYVPSLVPIDAWPETGTLFFLPIVLMAVTALGTLFPLEKSREELLKFIPLLLWVGAFLVAGAVSSTIDLYYMTLPAIVILGFHGMRRILEKFGKQHAIMMVSLAITTIIVLVNQLQFFTSAYPRIRNVIAENRELEQIGVWLKVHMNDGSISAERNGIIGYFTQTDVEPLSTKPTTRYVVSARDDVPGYELAFPGGGTPRLMPGEAHFALWEFPTPSAPPQKKDQRD